MHDLFFKIIHWKNYIKRNFNPLVKLVAKLSFATQGSTCYMGKAGKNFQL